jgi:phosphoesterase RecJ-like protein
MASTFERSARLLSRGAEYVPLIRNLYQSTSLAYAKLYGEGLSNLIAVGGGRGVGTVLSKEAFERFGVDQEALGHEFVNDYVRSVKADFVFLVKEMPDGKKRLSFRSKSDDVDVRTLAAKFGGGGHKMASGACSETSIDSIVAVIAEFAEGLK